MTNRKLSKIVIAAIFSLTTGLSISGQDYFSNWPSGTSPKEIGKRLGENFVKRGYEYETGKRQYVIYTEVCAGYGALYVAKEIKDKDLTNRLVKKFEHLLTPDAKFISSNAHVDYRVIGIVPLEIFMQTKDRRYLDFGLGLADKQWDKTTSDGITAEARYWIDDITAIQDVAAFAR